jgi:hypothetical protein
MSTDSRETMKLGAALIAAFVGVSLVGSMAITQTLQTASVLDVVTSWFGGSSTNTAAANCFVEADVLEKKSGDSVSYSVVNAKIAAKISRILFTKMNTWRVFRSPFPSKIPVKI